MADFNREEILRTARIFHVPGNVIELRIPKARQYKTISGYFDRPEALVDAVVGLADEGYAGIYFTINPVKPDLLARAANRYVKYAETTTSDADIAALHWLPIDLDAKRPAGISSTDEEHATAISKAREVRQWLIDEMGWPIDAFVLADSGNGAHLPAKIDLPNTSESVALVKRCLSALDSKFSDAAVHVDTATCNPARIWKLYGTMAKKGDSTPDRPHRMAKIIEAPVELATISREQLEALAASAPDRLEANAKKLENMGKKARQARIAGDEARTRRYAEAALRDEVLTLASTRENRNNQLNDSVFALGQFVATNVLSEAEVISELTKAAKNTGLSDEEIEKTLRSGLEAGKRHPRDTSARSHVGSTNLTLEDVCDTIPPKNDDGETRYEFNHSRATDSILEKLPIGLSDDGQLYYWHGTSWQPDAESVIFNELRSLAGKEFGIYKQREVIAALRHALVFNPIKFNPDPYLLGVKNGVVDLHTGDFREYKKEDYISLPIQVTYDPAAKCPKFLNFLKEVCPNVTDRLMLIDWLTIHAIGKAFPYVLFLLGLGRNGKGVYEHVLQTIFGKASFSFAGLEELNKSNFAKASLVNKRGLMVSEVGDDSKRGKGYIPTRFLKLSSGDGTIDSDRKNITRIQFDPFFKSTIDSNDMPAIKDGSRGWEERFCKADMPYHFVETPNPENPREKKRNVHLKAELTTDEELSGILNLIIYRACEICKTETIFKRSGKEYMEEYQLQSASVSTFTDRYCEYCPTDPNGAPIKDGWLLSEVYRYYEQWCTHINGDKVDIRTFGKSLAKFCPNAKRRKELEPQSNKWTRRVYGLMFFKDEFKESLSTPNEPLETIEKPSKTASAPNIPSNYTFWMGIKEKYGIMNNRDNHAQNFLYSEKCEKGHFDGLIGADSDLNGKDMVFNGAQSEPISILMAQPPEMPILSAREEDNSHPCGKCTDELPTIGKIDRPTPTRLKVRVRFKTDYETDLDGQMRQFKEGEETEVLIERAEAWLKRGVVELIA